MKKSIYLLMAFAAVTLSVVGCSKKKGGTAAYVPTACYNGTGYNGTGYNGTGYNGYNNGMGYNNGIGGVNGYQWINGQCIATATQTVVDQTACANVANNYSGSANCNYYGGQNYYNGQVNGAYNACSIYNTWSQQFYPVYYPTLQITVCASSVAYNTMWSYGTPSYYSGYQNVYQGCIPGNDPRCQSFGGTMGWFHAGVQLGVYF